MNVTVRKSRIFGEITPPASKSVAHRALICAALSGGASRLIGNFSGEDVEATVRCLNALGAKIERTDTGYSVTPIKEVTKMPKLDVGESGSTLRFMLSVVAALSCGGDFVRRGSLIERPNGELLSVLADHGVVAFEKEDILLLGGLTAGKYVVSASTSSQYISGLLLALPLLSADSEIELTGKVVSQSYLDITVEVLSAFGVAIEKTERGFYVRGGQKFKARPLYVCEADYSGAAAFFAVGALAGDVTVSGLRESSRQGDRVILDILKKMGAMTHRDNGTVTVYMSHLRAAEIDVSDCPDLAPAIAALAAKAIGETTIKSVSRLKIKECDRLSAICEMLEKAGIKTAVSEDTLKIEGGTVRGFETDSYGDHRMVMCAALLGLQSAEGVKINNCECVAKSYPNFFGDLIALGGKVDEE